MLNEGFGLNSSVGFGSRKASFPDSISRMTPLSRPSSSSSEKAGMLKRSGVRCQLETLAFDLLPLWSPKQGQSLWWFDPGFGRA